MILRKLLSIKKIQNFHFVQSEKNDNKLKWSCRTTLTWQDEKRYNEDVCSVLQVASCLRVSLSVLHNFLSNEANLRANLPIFVAN